MKNQMWNVVLPEAWRVSPVVDRHPIATCSLDEGDALLAHLTLQDGTSIMALSWIGGQRLACLGYATDWMLQEHYDGDMPTGRGEESLQQMWDVAVVALLQAKDETIAENPDECDQIGLR